MNFIGTNLWYTSDKTGNEFYNMYTTKEEAIEVCKKSAGGYIGQLYKVNFGIEDALELAETVIGGLYEKLYDCSGALADSWGVSKEAAEELDLKLGMVIMDFINENNLQPSDYCSTILDVEKVE